MKDASGIFGILMAVVAAIVGASFGGYYLYAALAPRYESTRRDVVLQSRVYSEGQVQNLYNLKIQYEAAPSPEAKQTIILAARHECAAIDQTRLPADLSAFCNPMGN